MELYKILIVDDEEEIRLGVIKKINWESYGFKVIGDAANGVEAWEKATNLKPDIVMTDIRMPFMDGLELSAKIQEIMPATKIIIFSGCDDFEYAQKAISINVSEYVLKPINSENLIEILKKLKCKLDEEYDEKRNVEVLQKYYAESIPVMREQFLTAAIEGKIYNVNLKEKLDGLRINFIFENFTVGIINLDINNDNVIFKENDKLLPISAQKILQDIMKNICEFTSFLYLDNVIVIGNLKEKEELNCFINGLNEVCRSFKKIIKGSMVIGLGKVYKNFRNINLSYKEAKNALEYKVILGREKVIYIEDVEPDMSKSLDFNENLERKFVDAIKVGTATDIDNILKQIFNIESMGLLPINEFRVYGIEVLTSLIKTIKSYNLNISEIIGEDFNNYLYLNNLNSILEIKEWFKDAANKANEAIKNERINSSKILVDKAKKYIKENYNDYELSVDKMCLVLHLSPAYFSTIFKKETGVSFINYLTDIRMEEAIRLLNTTDGKTSIIGQSVGYLEPNYFSYVFKKKFGISPTRYRKR
ncbi:response regulator [Clostridium sp. D53t1_180928_C8]|uniref:response regulator n=1 Tax=Clostridium sp. D53t1_180928_C8 TaxID=2787101 RepID=UPI0018AA64E9|nr:response regulator [Clostridium sp. D53t1_180928_C8]